MSSCMMFFYERSINEEREGDLTAVAAVSAKEYEQLKRLGLLTPGEIAHLQRYTKELGEHAIPSFLLLQYAMETLRNSVENPDDHADMLFNFYSAMYLIRNSQSEVIQIMDLPMPFQYFH